MTGPSIGEWEAVARSFGVEIAQVRRDHLISHALAAIAAAVGPDEVMFFGGTALARTHLPCGRLSEDIDLIASAPRAAVAAHIADGVRLGLSRSHGRPSWTPALIDAGDGAAVLAVPDGTAVRIQLLTHTGYPDWPTEVRALEQRYADAPAARMRVLTSDGFVVAKLSAWLDRRQDQPSTSSPTANSVTPSPISVTTPARSLPSPDGNEPGYCDSR